MKKSDLKVGMVVEFKSGEKGLFIQNGFIGHDGQSMLHISWIEEDLNAKLTLDDCKHDIMKVHSIKRKPYFYDLEELFRNDDNALLELIWERDEPIKEFTLEQIAEKLGIDVKNLRIKDK